MKNEISKILQNFGLNQNEAIVYLTLLKYPKMTMSEIARATNLKRASCYQYLNLLLAKDFVLRIPIGKRMFFGAVNPKKVLAIIRKRYLAFEKATEEMAKQYEKTTNKPKVVFYEGKREIKNIYEDLFKTIGDTYSIFPPTAFFENFTEQEYDDFDSKISRYALKSKDLIIADKYFRRVNEIRNKNGLENKKTKKLPESFKNNVDVLIHHDKVALISLRNLSGLVIEDQDIADLFKNIHSFIWKSL